MLSGNYVWDTQVIPVHSDILSPSHSQWSIEITGGMTNQAGQASAMDESIPVHEQGEYVPV